MNRGVGDVAADHRPIEEVDVVQDIGEAGEIIEVRYGRSAIPAGREIRDQNRDTARAVMHARAAQIEIVRRIARVEHDIAGRSGDHILDERTRKAQPPGFAHSRSVGQCQVADRCRRVAHADLFEHVQHRLMDSFDVAFAERLVLTARKPRADRTARSGIAALRSARLAAAARRASRKLYHLSPASAARRGSMLVWFSRFCCATPAGCVLP